MANKLEKQFETFLCLCKKPIQKFCLDQKCKEQSAFCEECEKKHFGHHKTMVFSI